MFRLKHSFMGVNYSFPAMKWRYWGSLKQWVSSSLDTSFPQYLEALWNCTHFVHCCFGRYLNWLRLELCHMLGWHIVYFHRPQQVASVQVGCSWFSWRHLGWGVRKAASCDENLETAYVAIRVSHLIWAASGWELSLMSESPWLRWSCGLFPDLLEVWGRAWAAHSGSVGLGCFQSGSTAPGGAGPVTGAAESACAPVLIWGQFNLIANYQPSICWNGCHACHFYETLYCRTAITACATSSHWPGPVWRMGCCEPQPALRS